MRDPRIDRLAELLVNYSLRIEKGDLVRIQGDPIAMPLFEAVYEALIKKGAFVHMSLQPDACKEIFLTHASEEQLAYSSPLQQHEVETIDAHLTVWASSNTKAMGHIDPKRQAMASAARKPIMQRFMQRAAEGQLKWCGTLFPTQASAQDAERSLRRYQEFVFKAGYLDYDDPIAIWEEIHARQQHVVDYLNGKKKLHFQTANGTDLHVNVEGMTWVNCSGHENFPDGEVFTGPNLNAPDGGVNGMVRYSFPAVYQGREVHDIELHFERGRVTKASASKNQDFLHHMLDLDEGARNVGEIAIGTNYRIKEYSKNILFDEKIGGTFHAAVGAGYPETGNSNESGLHWDMICDLRSGGTITVDGEIISKDGVFVYDEWPHDFEEPTS